MGASSSTAHGQGESNTQREVESLAASTGSLPMLRNCFSKLADPQTNLLPPQSLQQCFSLNYSDQVCGATNSPDCFLALVDHLGPSIVDLFFVGEKGGLSWVEFLRGYLKCCGRMTVSTTLNTLLRLFAATVTKAGLPLKLVIEYNAAAADDDNDCKINGSFVPVNVLMLLWICWIMLWDSKTHGFSKGKDALYLPDIDHLVLSAVVSCADVGNDFNVWDCNISGLEAQLPAGKFLTWALATVPSLTDCFTQFVNARLQHAGLSDGNSEPLSSSAEKISSREATSTCLLTVGRAWALSLTFRDAMSENILKPYFSSDGDETDDNILYRSSLHGRGLNRFWSNIEGYIGPLLILVSATCGDKQEEKSDVRKWTIGALTQGFENRDVFYGTSGNLYAISPVFHLFLPSGKEKNFVYSHLHPSVKVYEPHPKLVGIAFGGTIGNERIFIDEDFAKVTIHHHAYDKTYQPGSLFPNQGFLPVEASISEVEVWGLGGKKAKEVQTSFKKREELFTEQRRKVDLKTFASWEDSPEKMMMDMMANPNRVQKEDR